MNINLGLLGGHVDNMMETERVIKGMGGDRGSGRGDTAKLRASGVYGDKIIL